MLSLYVAGRASGDIPILLASAFFVLICITDTLYSRIPNAFTLAIALAGFAYNGLIGGPWGLLHAGAGLALGLALLLLPYLAGGMGGGDVKALAALGALLGPGQIFQVFLYMGLIGGVLALLHYLFAGNLRRGWESLAAFSATRDTKCLQPARAAARLRFPYAAAIAFGFFAFVHWGKLL